MILKVIEVSSARGMSSNETMVPAQVLNQNGREECTDGLCCPFLVMMQLRPHVFLWRVMVMLQMMGFLCQVSAAQLPSWDIETMAGIPTKPTAGLRLTSFLEVWNTTRPSA